MADSIDELKIELEVEGKKASNDLDIFIDKLEDLVKNLSKLDGKSLTSFSKGIDNVAQSTENLSKQVSKMSSTSKSLSTSMGTLSGKSKKVISIIKSIGKAIGNATTVSMDYLETLNYFDAAFGQVANNADLSAFKDLGYASAEEYYDSFSDRAKQLTAKMTGFDINADGTMSSSGMASLGIDPEQVMNYQAMFGQMSSSIGVTSENALVLSNVLTMIGADLASVKNMDFDKVWNDMASGLAGMSRTMDKYGVNIRNVNLQQTLSNLGIEENISNLNQNEKALLRTIILLDSTKYAWGDLANTIDQPANQLRLLNSNFQNLTRTIGNLFLPVVKAVLPYVNGLVIVLQRLVTWFGNIIGLDLSKITSSVGSSSTDISDLLDSTENTSDALGNAADNAKKLKNATLGIDELNINSPQEDSSGTTSAVSTGVTGGLLDAAFIDSVSEYQAVWDAAFEEMQARTENLADKIQSVLVGVGIGLGVALLNLPKVVKIFNIVKGVVSGVGAGIVEMFQLWIGGAGTLGESFYAVFGAGGIITVAIAALVVGLGIVYKKNEEVQQSFHDAMMVIQDGLQPAIEFFTNTVLPDLQNAWDGLLNMLKPLADFLNTVLVSIWQDMINPVLTYIGNTVIPILTTAFEILWNDVLVPFAVFCESVFSPIIELISYVFTILWQKVLVPLANAIGNVLAKAFEGLVDVWNLVVGPAISELIAIFQWMWDKVLLPICNFLAHQLKPAFETTFNIIQSCIDGLGISLGGLIDFLVGVFTGNWEKAWSGLKDFTIGIVKGLANSGIAILNGLISKINDMANISWDAVTVLGKEVIPAGNVRLFEIPTIPTFETGGFPEDGLFFANHNELVGTFSNGQTAVANNEQIVTGIKNGVREAVAEILAPYLSDIAQNTRETADKDFSVAIGDREIYKANLRGAKSAGKLLIT